MSEGGLLLYLPEQMEVGRHLSLKLFLPFGSKLETIEILVEVAWVDIHLEKDWGDYRTGVRFADISPDGLNKIKNFLRNLLG
jgi:c-di-GMP-binding flagellar brake protein YcgR